MILANYFSDEGTASAGGTVITFPWKARRVIITNDSSSVNLQYKFRPSETYGTLKPTETVSVDLNVSQVMLLGDAVYRVWSFG